MKSITKLSLIAVLCTLFAACELTSNNESELRHIESNLMKLEEAIKQNT